MSEEPTNPNRIIAIPQNIRVVPPTPLHEMLASGRREYTKFQNDQGDEFIEMQSNKFASDQMLVTSLLASRPGQKPIVPCSAIIAHKTKEGSWRYFSHRTPVDYMPEMAKAEALACELFLNYVFMDPEHNVEYRQNLQIKPISDELVRISFFDFHHAAYFWAKCDYYPMHTGALDVLVSLEMRKTTLQVSRDEIRKALILKLQAFSDLLQGEQGLAFMTEIVGYIPETPRLIRGAASPTDSEEEHIKAFRDDLLRRTHSTLALFQNK